MASFQEGRNNFGTEQSSVFTRVAYGEQF